MLRRWPWFSREVPEAPGGQNVERAVVPPQAGVITQVPVSGPVVAPDPKGLGAAAEKPEGSREKGVSDWAQGGSGPQTAAEIKAPVVPEAVEEAAVEAAEANEAEPTVAPTPVETRDEASGPSLGRVAGGLAVVVLLILTLAFCAKKMRNLKGSMGASWRPPADGVKVLSTHKVSKGHEVLIIDVLGEYLVVDALEESFHVLCDDNGALPVLNRRLCFH